MSDDIDEMGPIDYLVVEFPNGVKLTGEGFPLLVDLVDRGIIRIIDLVFVKKELDGSVDGLVIADLDSDGDLDLAVFEGVSSGVIGDDDINEVGGILEPGSAAGILVYENVWAGPVRGRAAALGRAAGGQRPHPGAGTHRGARRDRSLIPEPTRGRGARHAGTHSRSRSHCCHRRDRHRGVEPRVAPPGEPVVAAGGAAVPAAAVRAGAPAAAGRARAARPTRWKTSWRQLKQLGELKDQGILTQAEFDAQKAKILAG